MLCCISHIEKAHLTRIYKSTKKKRRTKMRKRLLAIIATAAFVVAMMPSMVFGAETAVSTDEQFKTAIASANDGDVIKLDSDITINEEISINANVTIDGQNHTITCTYEKPLRLYNSATIKNVTIKNTANNGRCIDTRVGNITVNLENVVLDATGTTNTQPLTIGGSAPNVTVNIKGSKINALDSGYAAIIFVPATINISDSSELIGYTALYFKDGSNNSVVNVKNSKLTGINNHSGVSNAFGTIVFEDDDITINVDNSTISGTSMGDQTQTVFMESEYANYTEPNVVNVYNGSKIIADNSETIATVSATNKVVFKDATCSVEIPAEFIAEGYAQDKTTGVVSKIETNKPEASPATGDNSMAPIAVAGLVLAAMAAVVATRRRTN